MEISLSKMFANGPVMRSMEFVPWDSIPHEEWYRRVNLHQAPFWYHHLDFLKALVPLGGMLSFRDGLAFIPWPVTRKFRLLKVIQQPLWVQRFHVLTSDKQAIIDIELDRLLKNYFQFSLAIFGQYDVQDAQLMRNRILNADQTGHFLRAYNSQTKRNLKSAEKLAPDFQACELNQGVQQYFHLVGRKLGLDIHQHWRHLENAINQSTDLKLHAFKLTAGDSGYDLAHLVVLQDQNRLYNLLPSTTDLGKQVMAMTTLIHRVLNHFDGEGLIFDFEGSMNQGIDRFYAGFGATVEIYTRFTRKNYFTP